jgi:hypothetical protein
LHVHIITGFSLSEHETLFSEREVAVATSKEEKEFIAAQIEPGMVRMYKASATITF